MKEVLIQLIKIYQIFISPLTVRLLGRGCRFCPTCSEYSIRALEKYGVLKGVCLSFRRVLSCHPLSSKPFFDPLK